MNRYSFSGKGNILIKATVAAEYGGKSFDANEPIAYFTDVMVDVNFNSLDKIAKTGTSNLLSESSSEPSILRVSNIKVSDSLQSLLYKKQVVNGNYKTNIKLLNSSEGALFLPIENDECLSSELFIYNSNKVRVTNFTLEEEGLISGLADGTYTIFYKVMCPPSSTYSLETPKIPYVSAEVHVLGNLNGSTGEVVMHLKQLSLLSRPILDFNNDTPFVDSLDFLIISSIGATEINYYANI